jgi:hypothetical protein
MRDVNLRPLLSAFAISALLTGGACAVEPKRVSAAPRCSVVGGEKVPQAAGGRDALCAQIDKALADVGGGSATVVVHVRRSHLAADVKLADGRALPQIGFAMSDAPLSKEAIKRFAVQIADAVRAAS